METIQSTNPASTSGTKAAYPSPAGVSAPVGDYAAVPLRPTYICFTPRGSLAALLPPTGAADRCGIPEHPVDAERLAGLLTYDRNRNPSHYAVVLVSEGARLSTQADMSFEGPEACARAGGPARRLYC